MTLPTEIKHANGTVDYVRMVCPDCGGPVVFSKNLTGPAIADSYDATEPHRCTSAGDGRSPRYELATIGAKDIENRFTYHPPKGDQAGRYEFLRSEALRLAKTIAANTPPSREQSLALTHLEAAVFFANAAIARNE